MERTNAKLSMTRQRAVIRRRRTHRARMPWKRALLLVLLTGGSFVASIGEEGRSAIAEVLRDPLSILDQRSPGGRGSGALLSTKTKPSIHLAAADGPLGPTERVLAPVRTRPPIDFGSEALVPEIIAPEIEAPIFVAPAGAPVGSFPGLPFITPATGGPLLPPETGGPGEKPATPPDVPPVVPEPATWMTMILGFFGAGWALRRSRRLDRVPSMDTHGGA